MIELSQKLGLLSDLLAPGTGERIKVRGRRFELTRAYSLTLTLPSPLRRERWPNWPRGAFNPAS